MNYKKETLNEIIKLKEELENAYNEKETPNTEVGFDIVQDMTLIVNYLHRLFWFTCERERIHKKDVRLYNQFVLDIEDERKEIKTTIEKLLKVVGE